VPVTEPGGQDEDFLHDADEITGSVLQPCDGNVNICSHFYSQLDEFNKPAPSPPGFNKESRKAGKAVRSLSPDFFIQ